MSCVVRVQNQDSTAQLVIPNKAVVEEMGEYFVYVAKDSVLGGGDKPGAAANARLLAMQKKVQLGAILGPNVIIKKGTVKDTSSCPMEYNRSQRLCDDAVSGPDRESDR